MTKKKINLIFLAQYVINDVDLRLYRHDAYGKGFMKKCKVSPDAYIQMALQLAYLRVITNLFVCDCYV